MNTCHACDTPTASSTTAVIWHDQQDHYAMTLEPLCTQCSNWARKHGIQIINCVGLLMPWRVPATN